MKQDPIVEYQNNEINSNFAISNKSDSFEMFFFS